MMQKKSLGVISVSVADLRREPSLGKFCLEKDPLQESQLIFGEKINILGEFSDWLRVSCPEQQRFCIKEGWHPYPGWIQKSQAIEIESFPMHNLVVLDLWATLYRSPELENPLMKIPFGSFLEGEQENGWWKVKLPDVGYIQASSVQTLFSLNKRQGIVNEGRKFLNSPYLWGGRSAYQSDYQYLTGVDCSGLVNLLYRIHGMTIPRDAHDQFLTSQLKNSKDLKLGDLVFLSGTDPQSKISHVMLYSENDHLLESAMKPRCVREISSRERFGRPLQTIEQGELIGDERLWFGSLLI